jgi:hypothetical protein
MKALIVGESVNLIMPTSGLLARSGFEIDLVTDKKILRHLKTIKNYHYVNQLSNWINSPNKGLNNYNLIVICDDPTLKKILDSTLPECEKIKLLPIISVNNLLHLCSKIELSKTFSLANVLTPNFHVLNKYEDIESINSKIRFPALIKIDFSGGGNGVYECSDITNLQQTLINKNISYPILIQEKIEGVLLDLSGFYQEGKLIYFSYAGIAGVVGNKFGPSTVRHYKKINSLSSDIFDELVNIGQALGANGFVNIGCIESLTNKKRYYFEADMRPTVWVEYPKYFEVDPAIRIKNYFDKGAVLNSKFMNQFSEDMFIIPYLLRMKWFEIVLNRYHCWNYFSNYIGLYLLWLMTIDKLNFTACIIKYIKPHIPKSLWMRLKKLRPLYRAIK